MNEQPRARWTSHLVVAGDAYVAGYIAGRTQALEDQNIRRLLTDDAWTAVQEAIRIEAERAFLAGLQRSAAPNAPADRLIGLLDAHGIRWGEQLDG